MACKAPLTNDDPNASISGHGCQENIKAIEKDHQRLLDGEDRGKKYQICPSCSRYMYLYEACQHICCQCGGQFCYECGVSTVHAGHWGKHITQCPLYLHLPTDPQAKLRLSNPQDRALAIREALLDEVLSWPPRPDRLIETALHGLQPVGPDPDPNNTNYNDNTPQPTERDLEWEREEAGQAYEDALRAAEQEQDEAEQAYDDALRAAERLAEGQH
jgi:hypothetical protein